MGFSWQKYNMNAYINAQEGEITRGDGWEKKVILLEDIRDDETGFTDFLEPYREWMLGAENMQWKYYKDKITGDLILLRR